VEVVTVQVPVIRSADAGGTINQVWLGVTPPSMAVRALVAASRLTGQMATPGDEGKRR
jgi:hypothetical protein